MWIEIQNRLPNRIDLVSRDLVARKLIVRTRRRRPLVPRARIVDAGLSSIRIRRIGQISRALGEVTGALQVGGDNSFHVDRILLTNLFQIDKKESLVSLEWTA